MWLRIRNQIFGLSWLNSTEHKMEKVMQSLWFIAVLHSAAPPTEFPLWKEQFRVVLLLKQEVLTLCCWLTRANSLCCIYFCEIRVLIWAGILFLCIKWTYVNFVSMNITNMPAAGCSSLCCETVFSLESQLCKSQQFERWGFFLYLYYNKGHKIKFHTGVSVIFSAFHRSRLHVTQNPWWLELTSLTGGVWWSGRWNPSCSGVIAAGHGLSRGSMSVPRANMEEIWTPTGSPGTPSSPCCIWSPSLSVSAAV